MLQGLSISNGLQGAVQILSWFENSMVAPERIKQYCEVESEGTEEQKELYSRRWRYGDANIVVVVKSDPPGGGGSDSGGIEEQKKMEEGGENSAHPPPGPWPQRGAITFDNVSFSYQPTSDLVLSNLSFHIPGGCKVGVVGRTGSGKSSLAMALFRIAELASGRVLLDGLDTSALDLATVRGAMEIIPQNPVLFKGTLRSYVDPFDEFSDAQVWAALEKAQMADSVARMWAGGDTHRDVNNPNAYAGDAQYKYLYAEVSDRGDNLSIGERQMLVMARALLRGAKILIMDESTASIDVHTEKKLQAIIKAAFGATTTITIAHRLETIMGSDKILVMSAGRVVDFDSPSVLLAKTDSLFRALAQDAGIPVPKIAT